MKLQKLIFVAFLLSTLITTKVFANCTCEPEQPSGDKNKALKFKLIALASILISGSIGVSIPFAGKIFPALRPEKDGYFVVKAFAAGVILATAFIHILPQAFESLTSPCLKDHPWADFPFTGFVAMVATIMTLLFETSSEAYQVRAAATRVVGDSKDEEMDGELVHANHGHVHGSMLKRDNGKDEVRRYRIVSQQLRCPKAHRRTCHRGLDVDSTNGRNGTGDSHVKSWIFLIPFSTLRKRLIKANPKTAKAAWDAIETIFQDNKRTRTISLKGELRVIQMGDQTADEYFSKIEAILTLLTDLGSDMSDDDVVTYAINGLSDKYGSLAQIIAHKDPFPDLATVRSMVATKELRLRSRSSVLSIGTTSSDPEVLLAEASSRNQTGWNNREWDNRTTTREVCRNFGRGFVVGTMLVFSFMTLICSSVLLVTVIILQLIAHRGLYLCMLVSIGGLNVSQLQAASTTLQGPTNPCGPILV
ncbi:zinc transporter 5-like protein [Tanacetum coccineum]